MFSKIVDAVNNVIWSPALVVLLIFAGLFFSFRTRFVQVRRLGLMVKLLFSKHDDVPEGKTESAKATAGQSAASGRTAEADNTVPKNKVSSFSAFCMALSGRVGTGNIVGVATAIALGGPGAIFWMWLIAFFGASTAFVESTLAQVYRFPHHSSFRGGPFCYIQEGLHQRWLGIVFAVICIIGYGVFLPTVQANGASQAFFNSYSISPLATGIGLAVLLAIVIIGGVRRIADVASVVTPFMALGYIILAIVVLAFNADKIPALLGMIVTNAFGINPICGGILGSTIMMGVKRGIFSNEAGQGGGAIVSATANVKHPAQQGLVQAFSVYVDTLLVCTATALMILAAGTYNVINSTTGELLVANAPELGNNYVNYTQAAVGSVFGGFGGQFVSIALIFFVFTTLMAYYFYSETSIIYICREVARKRKMKYSRKLEDALIWAYRLLLLGAVVFGAVRETDVIWKLGDIGVGLVAWVNVVAILILGTVAIKALREYEQGLRK
ncbi:MAG: alanine:cation symporter family protein [Bacteroidales bacterium]|nr:alanine:cation symporter family protein [Bacteroidales bacterium]